MDATVEVEYFDGSSESLALEYDSHDPKATLDGAYTLCAPSPAPESTRTWKTATFALKNARLENRQNAGADFRLCVPDGVAIRRVTVRR
jgi:hypothetical protein